MEGLNTSVGKVSIGAPPVFTFVPVVQKLPFKSIITEEEEEEQEEEEEEEASGALTDKPEKIWAASHESASGEATMSEEEIFKAEFVFIKDAEAEAGGARSLIPTETELQLEASADHMSLPCSSGASPWGDAPLPQNTPHRVAAGPASMETAVDKHGALSLRPSRDAPVPAEVSSGCFANRLSEDRSTSPTCSADLFSSSSRESLLSDKCCSTALPSSVASPVSLSRAASPCSSVRSGAFTPSLTLVKRHFLAPGSSLVHIPQTCFSSCESLSSACPLSPPPASQRHRPPLTRLSLLTAILRKGRLPVLSPAQRRPYTPCWPVNPVTLSFCNACSAASSVAPVPLELNSPVGPFRPTHEAHSAVAPLVKRCSEQVGPVPRWEQVISPPPVKKVSRVAVPPPPLLFHSNINPVSPAEREEIQDSTTSSWKCHHTHIAAPRSPEANDARRGLEENNLKNLITLSPRRFNNRENSAPQKWSQPSPSSFSKLHSLSQKLRSAPHCSPPSRSTPTPSSNCLSPSRYTPISFLGWPSPGGSPAPTPSPAATPGRVLSPPPSLSPRSATPSSRPGSGISDCSDGEGKKRKIRKIKLSYKSLAAIPTNTLLLDQQVIDEQVEREDSPNSLERVVADTHTEMCSPAQLRQQSEELYAVIDEILANSTPASSRASTPNTGLQNNSTLPKSLGRETKYASLSSLNTSGSADKKLMDHRKTKPGVIRPMTAVPRLTVQDEEEFHPNPFRQSDTYSLPLFPQYTKGGITGPSDAANTLFSFSKGTAMREEREPERRSPFSVCDLQITETEDQSSHRARVASAPRSQSEGRMKAFETHI